MEKLKLRGNSWAMTTSVGLSHYLHRQASWPPSVAVFVTCLLLCSSCYLPSHSERSPQQNTIVREYVSSKAGLLLIEVLDTLLVNRSAGRPTCDVYRFETLEGKKLLLRDTTRELARSQYRTWAQARTNPGTKLLVRIQYPDSAGPVSPSVSLYSLLQLDSLHIGTRDSFSLSIVLSDSRIPVESVDFLSSPFVDTLILHGVGLWDGTSTTDTWHSGGISRIETQYDYISCLTRLVIKRPDTTIGLWRYKPRIDGRTVKLQFPPRSWVYGVNIFRDSVILVSRDSLTVSASQSSQNTLSILIRCDGIDTTNIVSCGTDIDSIWVAPGDQDTLALNLKFPRSVIVTPGSVTRSDDHYTVRYSCRTGPGPPRTIEFEWRETIGHQGIGPGQFNLPEGVLFSENGDIWVCDSRNARIQLLSIAGESRSIVSRIQQPPRDRPMEAPTDIALVSPESMVIADWLGGSIALWDRWNGSISTVISYGEEPTQLSNPTGVSWRDSLLYITDMKHRVLVLDKNWKLVRQIGVRRDGTTILSKPQGIFVDNSGKVWVADKGNKRVCVFSADGSLLRSYDTIEGHGRFRSPTDVVVLDDLLLVADPLKGAVAALDTLGRTAGFLGNSLSTPFSLDVYPPARLLAVSDRTRHRIQLYFYRIR